MTTNPHDALFKAVFAQRGHAAGELRAVLPEALAEALDWSTFVHVPGSFADAELREYHTDLLFAARIRGGGEALVYVLFEHQSTPDPLMAYRMLRYMLRIWEAWREDHIEADRLPAIIPVVLYHGAKPWPPDRSFEALIDSPADLAPAMLPYVPSFRFLVDDISRVPDEALKTRAMTALAKLVLACFKHVRTSKDPLRLLHEWLDVMSDVPRSAEGFEALEPVVRYIMIVSERVEINALGSFLRRELGPEAEEVIMTVGQRLIEQGKFEGKLLGERELLMRLLRRRFGAAIDADVERRVAAAGSDQIETWAERVLSAGTLYEVLAD